jgi:hypothetical protein
MQRKRKPVFFDEVNGVKNIAGTIETRALDLPGLSMAC